MLSLFIVDTQTESLFQTNPNFRMSFADRGWRYHSLLGRRQAFNVNLFSKYLLQKGGRLSNWILTNGLFFLSHVKEDYIDRVIDDMPRQIGVYLWNKGYGLIFTHHRVKVINCADFR